MLKQILTDYKKGRISLNKAIEQIEEIFEDKNTDLTVLSSYEAYNKATSGKSDGLPSTPPYEIPHIPDPKDKDDHLWDAVRYAMPGYREGLEKDRQRWKDGK